LRLAASLALLVGVGLLVSRLGPSQPGLPDPLRQDPSGDPTLRTATVEILEPSGTLPTTPSRLVWTPTPAAARYRIELTTETGERLLDRETDQPSIELDAPLRERLATGVACHWSVAALDVNGAVLARSPRVSLRVAPGPPAPDPGGPAPTGL
jgi:hypothetical protein